MKYVLRIAGVAGIVTQQETLAQEGKYVSYFDPDAHGGRGEMLSTDHPREALLFATPQEAFAFWQQRSNVQPTRPDGKPNRPLTAFHMYVDHFLEED